MSNTFMFVGHVGNDPAVRKAGENEVVSFSVGLYAGKDKTNWIKVTIWNERMMQYTLDNLRKGSKVAVSGRLGEVTTYTGKNGVGIDIPVRADWVAAMEAKKDRSADGGQQQGQPQAQPRGGRDDEDIPFN